MGYANIPNLKGYYPKKSQKARKAKSQVDVTIGDMRKALGKIRRDSRFKQGEYIGLEFIIRTHTVELEATSMRYGKRAPRSLTGRKPLRVAALVSNRAQIKEMVALFWEADAQARKQWERRTAANERSDRQFGPPIRKK